MEIDFLRPAVSGCLDESSRLTAIARFLVRALKLMRMWRLSVSCSCFHQRLSPGYKNTWGISGWTSEKVRSCSMVSRQACSDGIQTVFFSLLQMRRTFGDHIYCCRHLHL